MSGGEDRPDRLVEALGLLAILILALVLRLRHLETLLPWFVYEDEAMRTTAVSLDLLRRHSLDPKFDFYPAFGFYANAAAYYLWALVGQARVVFERGPAAVLDYFFTVAPDDPRIIVVARFVSLAFGLATIPAAYGLSRFYLGWRFALLAALLLALNGMHASMSSLAKVDAIAACLFTFGLWGNAAYFRRPGWRPWLVSVVAAGFYVVTKNSAQLFVSFFIINYLVGLREGRGPWRALVSGRMAASVTAMFGFAFLGSPYTFIRLAATLRNVGWLYAQSELISTFHTYPAMWWLDRYHYLWTVVLPFAFGLPLFWLVVAGTVHHTRKWGRRDFLISANLVWFIYIFGSQSGGAKGGSFPYYLFLAMVPLGLLMVAGLLEDALGSRRAAVRALGAAGLVVAVGWSVAGADSQWRMFQSGYDQLGPWLRERAAPNARVLLISVYKPARALGIPADRIKSIWPHELNPELLDADDPDLIVIDTWLVAGFRKLYRQLWVAPLVDGLIAGDRGHRVVARFKIDYLGRSYFAAIDPEHQVELIVVARDGAILGEPGQE